MELFILTAIFLIGTFGKKTIDKLETDPFYLKRAIGELGQKEIPTNEKNNPRILEYLDTTNLGDSWKSKDETHWCSAFVNWVLLQSGKPITRSAQAKSWLNYGTPTTTPVRGDLVVFDRKDEKGNSIGGHVGFFLEDKGTYIAVLGGNQNNAVSIANFKKDNIISYRRIT